MLSKDDRQSELMACIETERGEREGRTQGDRRRQDAVQYRTKQHNTIQGKGHLGSRGGGIKEGSHEGNHVQLVFRRVCSPKGPFGLGDVTDVSRRWDDVWEKTQLSLSVTETSRHAPREVYNSSTRCKAMVTWGRLAKSSVGQPAGRRGVAANRALKAPEKTRDRVEGIDNDANGVVELFWRFRYAQAGPVDEQGLRCDVHKPCGRKAPD